MKTAVSIPDDLYDWAERERDRLGQSRSGLYAAALAQLRDRQQDAIALDTVRLNEVYGSPDESEPSSDVELMRADGRAAIDAGHWEW